MTFATKRRRAYKTDYARLYDHPFALFGDGPDNKGAKVRLWPNGEREIWISDVGGTASVRIVASDGPAGLGITITTHIGTRPLTVRAYNREYETIVQADDVREVAMCAYRDDPHSQAFKRWYDECETEADIALLGETYRRKRSDTTMPADGL